MKELRNKRILTIPEAVEYSGYSRGTIQNWINSGLLPYEELPSRGNGRKRFIRIRTVDLEDFLEKHYSTGVVHEGVVNDEIPDGTPDNEPFLKPRKNNRK